MQESVSKDCYISFDGFTIQMRIPLNQSDDSVERISFWFGITSASLALSRFIQAEDSVKGCKILELGCGLGLAGIVAAKLGAKTTFSDYKKAALHFARMNAQLNHIYLASYLLLDWEKPIKLKQFDLIIGSEIVYDSYYHTSLIAILDRAISPKGSILIADRPRRVVDVFLGRMLNRGYSCEESSCKIQEQGFFNQEISIYCIHK